MQAAMTGVWFPRRIDIAEHWQKTHPHKPFERPSQMARERFVERFGGIFRTFALDRRPRLRPGARPRA
jgi:hypothetical protein